MVCGSVFATGHVQAAPATARWSATHVARHVLLTDASTSTVADRSASAIKPRERKRMFVELPIQRLKQAGGHAHSGSSRATEEGASAFCCWDSVSSGVESLLFDAVDLVRDCGNKNTPTSERNAVHDALCRLECTFKCAGLGIEFIQSSIVGTGPERSIIDDGRREDTSVRLVHPHIFPSLRIDCVDALIERSEVYDAVMYERTGINAVPCFASVHWSSIDGRNVIERTIHRAKDDRASPRIVCGACLNVAARGDAPAYLAALRVVRVEDAIIAADYDE